MVQFNEFRGVQIPEHWKIEQEFKSGKIDPEHGDIIGTMEEIYPGFLKALLVWIVDEHSEIGSIHTMSYLRYKDLFPKK